MLFSTFQTAAFFQRNDKFPYDYLTNQEIQLGNKLKELNHQTPVGRLLISDSNLATHIMALTGFLSFYDPYFLSYLIDGSINASLIANNSKLLPLNQWYKNYIFDFNTSVLDFSPYTISDQLFNSTMSSAIPYFIKFHTRYIITLDSTVVTTDWSTYNSTLIRDLFLGYNSTVVFSTQDLLLWRLTY